MARQTGANTFAGTLEPLAGGPLDARAVVPTKADLTISGNFPYPYIGMIVSVQSEGKAYILTAADFTIEDNWEEIGSNESGSLQRAITASVDVGGIKTGDAYAIGTNYDDLWQDLLDPIKYPTFTAPSATISGGTTLLETGTSVTRTITVSFNRGSINPAYGTSGYRSGAATDYSLNNGTAQASNSFTETVNESNKTFKVRVNYAAGEQPKDSKGNDYSTALPAGNVETSTLTYKFDNPIWANTSSISTVAALTLLDHTSTKQKDMNFPAQTVANPEIFDIPASWTVTAVQVKNDLSGQYEDCSSEFTITNTTHNDAGGNSIAYKRYTDNRGYNAGARTIRVKWS